MPVTGDEIGPYLITGLIDEGVMASVFRVRDTRDRTTKAIKLLHLKDDDEATERVLREGRAMESIRHKNLVPVLEMIEHDGMPGFVMEHVKGLTLDEWINENEAPLVTRMNLFAGITMGLHHLHLNAIIHRDLQPANILVQQSERGDLTPRIVDLGLSKHLRDDSITEVGSVFGTLGYVAPEQLHSTSTVAHRADIFSLGCILYVLACEREPFDGETNEQLLEAIMATRYTPPRDVVPDLPHQIVTAIDACLVKDPSDRIPHCLWVMKVLQGAPWPPRSAEEWTTPVPPPRRE